MLRASSVAFGHTVDIRAIADRSVDAGVPGSRVILDLVDAVFAANGVPDARHNILSELGEEAFVDACAVYGNFSMMNRVAEATGIPVAGAAVERESATIALLGLDSMMKPANPQR